MAVQGRKPKPSFLKLVAGNPGKRPIAEDFAADLAAATDNGLEPPKRLKKRQRQLWDLYVRRAPWLTHFDVTRAFMWVELYVEFEEKPRLMVAGKVAQLRALGSELGLDPASRQRLGAGYKAHGKDTDGASKYDTV